LLLFKLGSWVFNGDERPPATPPLFVMADSAAFTVQVMATRDSTFAIREAIRLTQAGYYSYVMSPRINSTYFRVRTGLLAERTEADTLAQLLLRQQLISEFYVAPFDSSGLILPVAE
jgi:cell division septation protein DedD